jgi:hypothetical protein
VSVAPQNFDRASPEFRRHPVGETLTGVAVPRRGQVSHHRKGSATGYDGYPIQAVDHKA